MPDFVLPPQRPIAIPVDKGGLFPVRRLYCIGRNYADHVREMGHDPHLVPPIFFLKPTDALVIGNADTPYPPATNDYHYEMELVVAIGKGGAAIALEQALDHVWGYAAGLDMTRRDLQAEAKAQGNPWTMAKGFDHSAPIGLLAPASRIGHLKKGRIELKVNGIVRQSADIADMVFGIAEAIANLSRFVSLAPGDLIYTGTPAGVGPCRRGDVLEGMVEGVGTVQTKII